MADAATITDNRRAIVRVMSYEVLRGLAAMARLNGGDMIQFLVFTGIWTANTEHLLADKSRYAALNDIPPDSQRRPIPQDALAAQLAMPADIVARYVEPLVAAGYAERRPGGLVIPSAVFAQADMLGGSNDLHTRVMSMIVALRRAGFRFGDDASAV